MIRIYYNYYRPEGEERRREIDFCFQRIKELPAEIILLLEDGLEVEGFESIRTNGRPTFSLVYSHIREKKDGAINILINSDCWIPPDSFSLLGKLKDGDAWALSRWDLRPDGEAKHYDVSCSQDCWIWRDTHKIKDIGFHFGYPGCDNRFAWQLKEAGYNVLNPSKTFRVYHYHLSGERTWTMENLIKGKYLNIRSSSL